MEEPHVTQNNVELSDDQLSAVDRIRGWLRNPKGQLTLGGYAGTGKTTLLRELREDLVAHNVRFVAPTGKAAQVLVAKGIPATTVHRLIYRYKGNYVDDLGNEEPIFEDEGTWGGDDKSPPGLLVVDESSMINTNIYRDIMARRLPVLWVGDHGQLAPVGGDPGLMKDPDIRLETIHRQAEGSPILRLAHDLRRGIKPTKAKHNSSGAVTVGQISDDRRLVDYIIDHDIDQVIVGTNALRHKLNKLYRMRKGYSDQLVQGDRVICLANNYSDYVFNGQIFVVNNPQYRDPIWRCNLQEETTHGWRLRGGYYHLQDTSLGNPKYTSEDKIEGALCFDYGYAITGHKSQGSEWNRVLMVLDDNLRFDQRRWGYTVATRPKQHISVVLR